MRPGKSRSHRATRGHSRWVSGRGAVSPARRIVAAIVGLGLSLAGAGCEDVEIRSDRPDASLAERRFQFDYEVEIAAGAVDAGAMDVFLPIASDTPDQRILEFELESDLEGEFGVERIYGNRFWHGRTEPGRSSPISVSVRYTVARRENRPDAEAGANGVPASFLEANERVVVAHPILDPIREEIASNADTSTPGARARAIYDWVVDNVEYKKVGSGWGNGDTFWACSERYGNCTDFHSLFISLARTEGIPARFEMGFPIPLDRPEGKIGGYHCWVEFWLPETGWFPIDASEAFKHPEKRELFYGAHPPDRFHFSTGRDLRLGPAHRGRPLNYFIYPYVEVDGKAANVEIESRFSYREEDEAGRDSALAATDRNALGPANP